MARCQALAGMAAGCRGDGGLSRPAEDHRDTGVSAGVGPLSRTLSFEGGRGSALRRRRRDPRRRSALPGVQTAIGPIRYPQPIIIVSREIGREALLPLRNRAYLR